MKTHVSLPLAMVMAVCAAVSTQAHHSHPYFYDQCRSVTVEGRVVSVEWKDPHTQIVFTRDDGTAYTVDWNPVTRLTNTQVAGPARAALVAGARIVVTGNPIRTLAQIQEHFPDHKTPVNPNTVDPMLIRRSDSSWNWTRTPGDAMPDSVPARCGEPKK